MKSVVKNHQKRYILDQNNNFFNPNSRYCQTNERMMFLVKFGLFQKCLVLHILLQHILTQHDHKDHY